MTTTINTQTTGSIMTSNGYGYAEVLGSQLSQILATGELNGRKATPRLFRGEYVPAVGSVIPTAYGSATVLGYEGTALRVEVTEYDDAYVYVGANGVTIRSAYQQVAHLSEGLNESLFIRIDELHSRLVKENGMSEKKFQSDVLDNMRMYGDNEVLVNIGGLPLNPKGLYMVDLIGLPVESFAEKAKRLEKEANKLLRAARKALRELDADMSDCPEDILAEMESAFGA